jgi:hypothetical protein
MSLPTAPARRHGVLSRLMCLWLLVSVAAAPARGEAIRTELVHQPGGEWQLLRGGKPYFIKGAGGNQSMSLLREMGGNSLRTWSTDGLGPILDQAQRLGISVTVGIWLGQERTGRFNYNNAEEVANQYQQVREQILMYKDHPAVLMWGIGNEMEGYGNGDNAAVWSAVNNIASMARRLDPNHPTMTVVAEIGGERVQDIHRLCPDIDIVGINSYGGLASIPRRYLAAVGRGGHAKPYVITEFGPPGMWEVGRNPWGAVLEPTSTQKAAYYRQGYNAAIASQASLCLGSYAFLWGQKQEGTMTWFGMFLSDGTRLSPVQTMSQLWTGAAPAVPGPTIEPVELRGPDMVPPGAIVRATVAVADAGGRPVHVEWQLHREPRMHGTGGDAEPATEAIPQAIVASAGGSVEVRMPTQPGIYRLFAIARDDAHNGATANVLLQVKTDTPAIADSAGSARIDPAVPSPAAAAKPFTAGPAAPRR